MFVAMKALWLAVVLAKLALLGLLLHRRTWREYPAFSLWVAYCALAGVVQFGIANWTNCSVWFWTYTAATVAQVPIILLALGEVFLKVFRPFKRIPMAIRSRLADGLPMLVITAVVVAMQLPGVGTNRIIQLAAATDRILTYILCGGFGLIVLCADHCGVSRQHKSFGIALGFLFQFASEVAFTTMLGLTYISGGAWTVNCIRLIAYLVTCVVWARYFLKPVAFRAELPTAAPEPVVVLGGVYQREVANP